MNTKKHSGKAAEERYLTPWTMDIPLWIAALLVLPIMLFAVFAGYWGDFSIATLCSGCMIIAFGAWSRMRRLYREDLARKAVAMLSSTHEGASLDVPMVMREALKHRDFVSGFCAAMECSVWRVHQNERVAQWVITFPSDWSDVSWKWCAFGLICAGRPTSMHCEKAQKNENNIVMEMSVAEDIGAAIGAWNRTMQLSFNLSGRGARVSREHFIPTPSNLELKEKRTAGRPWTARVVLQPEDIDLTLAFNGKTWSATTARGAISQEVTYDEWSEMWSVWRHFPEAETVLELNSVD